MRAILTVAAVVLGAADAAAGGCPKTPVAEHGGEHWCYSAGKRGHVHLWKPASYAAAGATTVVYLHGHNIGLDGCPKKRYLDCLWDAHGLATQFAASGLNALFIAVEGPVGGRGKPKWGSLDEVLRSVRTHGGVKPTGSVTVAAHSAGIFTAANFLGDGRLAHVIALDALYLDSPKRLAAWYRGSKARRLTLVGAESRHVQSERLGKALGCPQVDALSAPYPASGRCLAAVNANVAHMDVAMGGMILPTALARAAPTVQKPKKAKKRKRR